MRPHVSRFSDGHVIPGEFPAALLRATPYSHAISLPLPGRYVCAESNTA